MRIYWLLHVSSLSNILKRSQYKAWGHLLCILHYTSLHNQSMYSVMCWLLPALSMASPTLVHLFGFWFLLCCSLALQGEKPAAIGTVTKAMGMSKETQERQWTKTFWFASASASATLDFNFLREAMIDGANAKQLQRIPSKNLQMPSI